MFLAGEDVGDDGSNQDESGMSREEVIFSGMRRDEVILSRKRVILEVVVVPVSRDMVFALWFNVVIALRWKIPDSGVVNCYYSDGYPFYFVSMEEMLLVGEY